MLISLGCCSIQLQFLFGFSPQEENKKPELAEELDFQILFNQLLVKLN